VNPRRSLILLLAVVAAGTLACDELLPTSGEDALLPFIPQTFEVLLPYSDFVDSVRVFGGFGTITGLATAFAANEYEGELNANAVFRFEPLTNRINFADSAGNSVLDTLFTIVGGRVRVEVDTTVTDVEGPVEVAAGVMQTRYNARTASWEFAVDTLNAQVPWGVPGGGPVSPLGVEVYEAADTLLPLEFEVDSAQAERLARGTDAERGLLLEVLTEGARVEFLTATFEVEVRPSFLPDTTFFEEVAVDFLSFLYEEPEPREGEFRVGGAPSKRAVLFLSLPDSVDAPPAVCGPSPCRVAVTPETVNYGELLLQVVPGAPGFERTLVIPLDAREVLAPALLPESPLGSSLTNGLALLVVPNPVAPPTDLGRNLKLPVTDFLQGQYSRPDATGSRMANLALLTQVEPFFFSFVTFAAGGTEGEPLLRLLVTPTEEVRFR